MGLVNLYGAPATVEQWQVMWWNNWNDHLDIVQAIKAQRKIALQTYLIHPLTLTDLDVILNNHQQFHTDMNNALGTNGQDLSVLDIEDKDAVQAWIWQHYNEHQAVHAVLKL